MNVLDGADTNQLEGGASFSLRNRAERAAWKLCWALAAGWTPPPLHAWRRFLLRSFGARIGKGVRVYGSARVWYPRHLTMADFSCLGPGVECYNQGRITIGRHVIVSQRAHLCAGTHDISDPHFQITPRPVRLDERCWVAAEAFVGPGVSVGEGAVLGARGVAMKDLAPWTVYSGNPAVPVKQRRLRAGT